MSIIQEQSIHLSSVLDSVGYSRDMVEVRRDFWKHIYQLRSTIFNGMVLIDAGSQAEGIGKPLVNDIDTLQFMSDIIYTNDVAIGTGVTHFYRAHDIQPGYCLLIQHRSGQKHRVGSKYFRTCIQNRCRSINDAGKLFDHPGTSSWVQTGPASTLTMKHILTCSFADFVHSFPCYCPAILAKWSKRSQKYSWPSQTCREQLSTKRGNVVPIGMTGSSTEDLEWRYCFNEIETLLVQNLNDTQLKLYVMLKIINTDILTKNGFTLSSYMWKNVVFWNAELHEQSYYKPENLYSLVVECLERMKLAARETNLPYYMIPERNLFKEKVNDSDRARLQDTLSDMIISEFGALLGGTRIGKFIPIDPVELVRFGKKRNSFEWLYQKASLCTMLAQATKPAGRHSMLQGIMHLFKFLQTAIIMSGLPHCIEEIIMKSSDWDEMIKNMMC